MRTVTKNAEQLLLNELQENWQSHPQTRVLHLACSSIFSKLGDEQQNEFLDICLKVLQDKHYGVSCSSFITFDFDIFVISRVLTHKLCEEIKNLIESQMTVGLTNAQFQLFEIGVDWPHIKSLADEKLKAAKETAPKQPQASPAPTIINELIKTLDPALIGNLDNRRKERQAPEILVVEDDAFSRQLLTSSLQKSYSVTMTEDGEGALISYINKAPDVIFLDIGLPDINGHDVLQQLHQIDPLAYVIMFSANGDRKNILKSIELGASGFVGKPFSKDTLMQYINKCPTIQNKMHKEISDAHPSQ